MEIHICIYNTLMISHQRIEKAYIFSCIPVNRLFL